MPACPNGAEPIGGQAGTSKWLDKAALAASVAGLLVAKNPLALASLALSLVDVDEVCAENMDPPELLTEGDMIELALAVPFSNVLPTTKATAKIYAWLRYGIFLTSCQCKLPAPPTPLECPYQGAGFHLESGQASPPVQYQIADSTYASWATLQPPPATGWAFAANVSVGSNTVPASQRFLQWSSDQTTWNSVYQFASSGTEPVGCNSHIFTSATPRMPQLGFVRILNNAAASNTWTNLNVCFCAVTSVPPPMPIQPDLPNVPNQPSTSCTTDDLCKMIAELARRLTNVSAQLSDVQATIGGRDVHQVLSSRPISGEGEVDLVLGTRAISVELLTLGPEAFTSALGRPRGLMRVGSVRYGDHIGYSPRRFIDGDRFNDIPPPGALTVSWQLLSGTSGTLKFLG